MMPGERGSSKKLTLTGRALSRNPELRQAGLCVLGGKHPQSSKILDADCQINDLVGNNKGYVNGQERLAIAVSSDRGVSLDKQPELLSVHPPANVSSPVMLNNTTLKI
jgi:hypothetical protein